MADSEARSARSSGDRRDQDRRSNDRRRSDRRTPPPWWRRPSAFVGYGVTGALAAVLLVQAFAEDPEEVTITAAIETEPAAVAPPPVAEIPPGQVREGFTAADYQTLIAEGDRAVGQIVRTDLYCTSITSTQVRDIEGINPALAALADSDGRVGGAECRWGREDRSAELLLIVPPNLAGDFASGPEVELNFVRRREVPAQLEWLGRSEALSLRYAGVLRGVVGATP
jgi:hypothetical protein